jgi:hypothetical protein
MGAWGGPHISIPKNFVFLVIKTQFAPHRRHITPPLEIPAGKAVTVNNSVFRDIETQFAPHRRHITSTLQIPSSRFDSWQYRIFWEVVGLERRQLSLMGITEELPEWNVTALVCETEINNRRDSLCWSRNTFYQQKLTLTSPTRDNFRSVDIIRLWTTSHEILLSRQFLRYGSFSETREEYSCDDPCTAHTLPNLRNCDHRKKQASRTMAMKMRRFQPSAHCHKLPTPTPGNYQAFVKQPKLL